MCVIHTLRSLDTYILLAFIKRVLFTPPTVFFYQALLFTRTAWRHKTHFRPVPSQIQKFSNLRRTFSPADTLVNFIVSHSVPSFCPLYMKELSKMPNHIRFSCSWSILPSKRIGLGKWKLIFLHSTLVLSWPISSIFKCCWILIPQYS